MVQGINGVGPTLSPANMAAVESLKQAPVAATPSETPKDTAELSNTAPKIGFFRLAFKRLTKEQIAAVNETRKLPENAKFYAGIGDGNYTIGNKILNLTRGTRTLPEGSEVRRTWLGFTTIVAKDTESIFIKKK